MKESAIYLYHLRDICLYYKGYYILILVKCRWKYLITSSVTLTMSVRFQIISIHLSIKIWQQLFAKHFTTTSLLISVFNRHLSFSLLHFLWHKGTVFLPPQDKSDASIYKMFLLHLVQFRKAVCSRKNNLTVYFIFKRIQHPWYFEKK